MLSLRETLILPNGFNNPAYIHLFGYFRQNKATGLHNPVQADQ